ncbi:histone H1.5-like [Scyliorhinus torazame]|uniref:histone H1.5-like n=1 Tax=Scyliorhinus torazame TaxID=75743 RepID=UPI003B5AF724
MSDSAAAETAPPAATPVKAVKKQKAVPRKKQEGPGLGELILQIVAESGDRKGISLQAIKKALRSKGVDVDKQGNKIKQSVRRSVDNGILAQVKGTGASGSFKIVKKTIGGKVKTGAGKKPSVKKTAAKKSPKKTAATKTSVKKPAAKKSPKKPAAKKSPRKPAAKKSPKKPAAKKSPKKPAAKKSPKKPAAKKAAIPQKSAKKAAPKKRSPVKKTKGVKNPTQSRAKPKVKSATAKKPAKK